MSNISTYTEYGQLGTMDTEKIENLKAAAEGGGGGGGGDDFVVVHLTMVESDIVGDMTYGEMRAALDDGKIILVHINTPYTNGACFSLAATDRFTIDFSGMKLQMLASSGNDNNVWSTVGD